MASNLTIESPNLDKINSEAGQFTSDAINTLWLALNDTRKELRIGVRQAKESILPKVKTISPTAQVDNLDLEGAAILVFNGSSAVSWTGIRAPEPGKGQVVFVIVTGTGTITAEESHAGSTAAHQLTHTAAADIALTTGRGIVYAYVGQRWRQVV